MQDTPLKARHLQAVPGDAHCRSQCQLTPSPGHTAQLHLPRPCTSTGSQFTLAPPPGPNSHFTLAPAQLVRSQLTLTPPAGQAAHLPPPQVTLHTSPGLASIHNGPCCLATPWPPSPRCPCPPAQGLLLGLLIPLLGSFRCRRRCPARPT